MTWGNIKNYPANAGNKGDITTKHGYLHMNAYSVLISPRLKVGSAVKEDAIDRGKLDDKGMRELFGKVIVPNFCSSTAKLSNRLQCSEGQEVTINANNQAARFKVTHNDEQKVMIPTHHAQGIRWKILAIMGCDKTNKMGNAGELVFLLWSEHITQWMNCEQKRRSPISRIPGGNS